MILKRIATIIKADNLKGIVRDPKDNIILGPANEIKIDYIISGDKDLLELKDFKGAKIIRPEEFVF